MRYYTLKITPLTGIHIGTGEEMSPLEYKIGKLKDGNEALFQYSIYKIVSQLKGEKKDYFLNLIAHEDYSKLVSFMHTKDNFPLSAINYLVWHLDNDFKRIYRSKLGDFENQLLISKIYRNGNYKPVIPGSSIKGAIRTAILNKIVRDNQPPIPQTPREFKTFENKVLNSDDSKTDPFRALIVRDCLIESLKSVAVVKIDIYKKRTNEFQGQQIFIELIRGLLMGNDKSYITEVLFDNELLNFRMAHRNQFNFRGISRENIIESCNWFYKKVFNDEYEKFYKNNYREEITDIIENLKKEIEITLSTSDSFLLRFGRFSQVESMTFNEKYRRPVTRKGYGNTRSLALYNDFYYPLGWVKAEFQEIENA